MKKAENHWIRLVGGSRPSIHGNWREGREHGHRCMCEGKVVMQPLEVLSDYFSGLSERGSTDGREDKALVFDF